MMMQELPRLALTFEEKHLELEANLKHLYTSPFYPRVDSTLPPPAVYLAEHELPFPFRWALVSCPFSTSTDPTLFPILDYCTFLTGWIIVTGTRSSNSSPIHSNLMSQTSMPVNGQNEQRCLANQACYKSQHHLWATFFLPADI